MLFSKQIRLSMRKGLAEGVSARTHKTACRRFADELNIPSPRILVPQGPVESIVFSQLPDECVLQFASGCSCRGVALLKRDASGFIDLRRGQQLDIAKLVCATKTDQAWVEELLPDAHDVKLWIFDGDRVGVILHYDRVRKLYRATDANYHPVSGVFSSHLFQEGSPRALFYPKKLLEYAIKAASQLNHWFVSVDMYDSPAGAYLGEITPHPGAVFGLSPKWDADLGAISKRFGQK